MKKKANGRYRARLNARGYEHVEGVYFNIDFTAAPVTNDTTIKVVYLLAALAKWKTYVIDVQGAFLNGRFEAGERLFLKIPEGLEHKYNSNQVLRLNCTIYGLKQSAQEFWTELLKAIHAMGLVKEITTPAAT